MTTIIKMTNTALMMAIALMAIAGCDDNVHQEYKYRDCVGIAATNTETRIEYQMYASTIILGMQRIAIEECCR